MKENSLSVLPFIAAFLLLIASYAIVPTSPLNYSIDSTVSNAFACWFFSFVCIGMFTLMAQSHGSGRIHKNSLYACLILETIYMRLQPAVSSVEQTMFILLVGIATYGTWRYFRSIDFFSEPYESAPVDDETLILD